MRSDIKKALCCTKVFPCYSHVLCSLLPHSSGEPYHDKCNPTAWSAGRFQARPTCLNDDSLEVSHMSFGTADLSPHRYCIAGSSRYRHYLPEAHRNETITKPQSEQSGRNAHRIYCRLMSITYGPHIGTCTCTCTCLCLSIALAYPHRLVS